MLGAGTLGGLAAATLRRRAGSPSARYKLALTSGFVIACLTMATVVIGRPSRAEDFFNVFGGIFSAPQQEPAAPAYQSAAPSRHARRAPRRAAFVEPVKARHVVHDHRRVLAASAGGGEGGAPMRLGRASMCVRLCDGFAFPVGDFHQGDLAAHEATCRSECPGAQTALYVLPSGTSAIEDAREARTGKAYSQKAAGFHYTTYIDEACSCHPKGGNRVASLLRDFTLRRGDAVMTASGVKVFHGGAHFPHLQADFVRLGQSRDVRKDALTSFRAIERASLVSNHPAVAQALPFRPAAGVKALDRQAALAP